MRGYSFSLVAAVLVSFAGAAVGSEGSVEKGERVFRKCQSCHMVGDAAKNRVGPALNDIIGKAAGAVKDFKYSKALADAADAGLIWTSEELDAFLENPKTYLKGTKMSFRGLKKPQDRADVIAYLATFADGEGKAAAPDFVVAPEVLAIVGDPEYGEYLASECTTCHRDDGGDEGIPGIVGWDADPFVTAMHAYREKHRDHPVMQMISGRLSDEEIAALAAYFGNLDN